MSSIDEIILANPDSVGYLVQLVGNTDPILRYVMNNYDDEKAIIQQVDTFNLIEVLRSTGGYEQYTPPLEDPLEPYKNLVSNAISYFKEVQIEFAAENITMGITQTGKTKDVSDYLAPVLRYGQTGSLYEVVNEINSLIAATVPADLSPFVTVARLEAFRDNILAKLS